MKMLWLTFLLTLMACQKAIEPFAVMEEPPEWTVKTLEAQLVGEWERNYGRGDKEYIQRMSLWEDNRFLLEYFLKGSKSPFCGVIGWWKVTEDLTLLLDPHEVFPSKYADLLSLPTRYSDICFEQGETFATRLLLNAGEYVWHRVGDLEGDSPYRTLVRKR